MRIKSAQETSEGFALIKLHKNEKRGKKHDVFEWIKCSRIEKKLLILAKNAGLYLAKTAVASCVEAWIEISAILCAGILAARCFQCGLKIP